MTRTATRTVDATKEDVEVDSKLLGPLSVMPSQIYDFAEGLYGFPEAKSLALIPVDREGFFWLQSLHFSALTFLMIDPFMFVDDYTVDLTSTQLAQVGAEDPSDILVLSILTLPRDPQSIATVNLHGPIAINVKSRRGTQTIIDSTYGVRHPIDVSLPS